MRILTEFDAMGSLGHPCSTIEGSAWYLSLMRSCCFSITCWTSQTNHAVLFKRWGRYLSLMRPGRFPITKLDQANNLCSTIQASVGHLSLVRPGRSSITSLDQQSSQASIERGNQPLWIGPPSHRLYRQGISNHPYAIFNNQNDQKKTKFDYRLPNWQKRLPFSWPVGVIAPLWYS